MKSLPDYFYFFYFFFLNKWLIYIPIVDVDPSQPHYSKLAILWEWLL